MGVAETEPAIGEPVTLRLRKWDGSPHRQASLVFLGADEYGRWFTIPTGVEAPEPGAASATRATHVMLLPDSAGYLAHFNAPPARNSIYADLTTRPEFGRDDDGWAINVVDLELDVVRRASGRTWIDDEDEFAQNTIRYDYPADLVAGTRATADALLAAVRSEAEPFGTVWRRWLDRAPAIIATPPLAGERIDLEPLRVDHADELAPALDDPALHTFTGGEPATVDELRSRYARQVLGRSADGTQRWLNWVVRRRADGQAIGFVQATVAGQDQLPTAEVAWVIGTAFQGQRYAREAAALMVDWLRSSGVGTIVALIHPDHGASGAVAGGLGLTPTEELIDGEVRWISSARRQAQGT